MTGLPSLLSRLSALPGKAESALLRAARDAAEAAADAARASAPVRTGALRASIAAVSRGKEASAAARAPYAAFAEARRPYLRPARDSADYPARAARALKEGLR